VSLFCFDTSLINENINQHAEIGLFDVLLLSLGLGKKIFFSKKAAIDYRNLTVKVMRKANLYYFSLRIKIELLKVGQIKRQENFSRPLYEN
jgi:hypothetical protein